jgi:hypothetical protein
MSKTDLKDLWAPIASVAALLSLLLNVYMGFLLRRRRPHVARVTELREALRAFINSCAGSRLLTVPPHYEQWGFGFESLSKIRAASVECNELYSHVPDSLVPRKIKTIIFTLQSHIGKLYQFRDSFTSFSKNRRIISDSEIAKWPNFERAKHALDVLQTDFRNQREELKTFLSGLE